MGIDLDYDTALSEDAEGFGISSKIIQLAALGLKVPEQLLQTAEPIAHPSRGTVPRDTTDGASEFELEAAVVLAMEACQWELTFYTWCDEYLHGTKQEAMADILLVRELLKRKRNYWGPCYFTTKSEKAKVKYYGLMAAQAAIGAVERRNKLPLIQKVIYYTGVIEESVGV